MITRTYAYFGMTPGKTEFSGCIEVKSWSANSRTVYNLILRDFPDFSYIINITRI